MTDGEHKLTESGIPYFENSGIRLFVSNEANRLIEEGETFDEYKLRRSMSNKLLKRFKRGRLLWDPYPFKGMSKGLVSTESNREAVFAYMNQLMNNNGEEIEGGDSDGI